MRKILTLLSAIICILFLSACEIESQPDTTGVTALKFVAVKDCIELEAGESNNGYFKVDGTQDFSIDDIEFITSDPSVATFTYDQTCLETCVYFTIHAISDGKATICAQTKDGKIKTDDITVVVSGYQFNIVSTDDISAGGAKRHRIRATVAESLVKDRTDEQIQAIMQYIATKYANAHKINAVTLFLYIDGDNTNDAYTVGCCTYAPYGDLAKASEVSAGDYSLFDFCNIDILSTEERNILRNK